LSKQKARPRKRMSAEARREVIEQAAYEVFAERGYHGASIDEICRRSGVTPPVLYDHFKSKVELHKRLLERTRDELIEVWRGSLPGPEPPEVRIPRAIDAWAAYMQEHPYVARMFFIDTTGEPEIAAIHDQISMTGVVALGAIVGGEAGGFADAGPVAHEMAAAVMRAGLAGLAIWWTDHPDVPREQVVAIAVNVLWNGMERMRRGDLWEPDNLTT
jgi:AcrR family transcriptional regulator